MPIRLSRLACALIVLVAAAVACASMPVRSSPAAPDPVDEIRAALVGSADAFNRGDLDGHLAITSPMRR